MGVKGFVGLGIISPQTRRYFLILCSNIGVIVRRGKSQGRNDQAPVFVFV